MSEVSQSCQWCPERQIWAYHVSTVLFLWALTRVWPSHWASSLCQHAQRRPNICSVSPSRLIRQRRHWVALRSDSLTGGWLSGRMWADSCPGDWRNDRWSRLADHRYLPWRPKEREGSLVQQMDDGLTNDAHLKAPGRRRRRQGEYLCDAENSGNTCKRSNGDRPLPANERDKCIALGRVHGYTFPIQVVSRKCLIKWLALNKPKWAPAKWLIPARGEEDTKIIAWKIC